MKIFILIFMLVFSLCNGEENKDNLYQNLVKYSKNFKILSIEKDVYILNNENRNYIFIPKEIKNSYIIKDMYKSYIKIYTPVDSYFLGSTTQAYIFNILSEIDKIRAVSDDKWYFEKIDRFLKDGKILNIGFQNSPNIEKLKALNPELSLLYGGKYGQIKLMKKMDNLNLKYLTINEYMENSALGRLEWIKVVALSLGKYRDGDKVFKDYEKKINDYYKNNKVKKEKKILIGMVWAGKFYVTLNDSYVGDILNRFGALNIADKYINHKDIAVPISKELFKIMIKRADRFILTNMDNFTIDDIKDGFNLNGEIDVIKNKKIYQYKEDWFQRSDMIPERIEDFYNILNDKDGELKCLRKLK